MTDHKNKYSQRKVSNNLLKNSQSQIKITLIQLQKSGRAIKKETKLLEQIQETEKQK